MTPELADAVIACLARDLAATLDKAAGVMKAARGEMSRAAMIEGVLDVEMLVFDAQSLITASCLIQRRAETGSARSSPP